MLDIRYTRTYTVNTGGTMYKHLIPIILTVSLACACNSTPITIIADPIETTIETDSIAASQSKQITCSEDMVEVEGDYCPEVEQVCKKVDLSIHNANGFVKCDLFEKPSRCLSKNRKHLHFCIDRYEFPNHKEALPLVMISWNQMNQSCHIQGKRLCQDIEWTQACEGPDMLPYPYGYERSSAACNIDHDQRTGFDATQVMTPELVARLDQRVPSGSMPGCVSSYGVHDMTGNVDESVVNTQGKPFQSAEMGGHWVRGARNRCRPRTIAHNEDFQFYEIGGRCCKDPNGQP